MRLPRRVPWASIAELDELCTWIYSDEADLFSKRKALNRLAAWRAMCHLPQALESVQALLSVTLQDEQLREDPTPSTISFLPLRQAYGLALVRFVNGLVDPMQQGAFARSIASIAAQIGLPVWFVEMRHASTHEDLPSLEVLREATKQAMAWLLDHFFIPTIFPPAEFDDSTEAIDTEPLRTHLKEYKALQKSTARDASLRNRMKPNLARLLRDFERWVVGAKAVNWSALVLADEDEKETLALDVLCEVLVAKGGLIRSSKSSRRGSDSAKLPPNLLMWDPLLSHLHTQHPTFFSQLLRHLASGLTEPQVSDRDLEASVVSWIAWLVRSKGKECGFSAEDAMTLTLAGMGSDTRAIASAQTLLGALDTLDPAVKAGTERLLAVLEPDEGGKMEVELSSSWESPSLDLMQQRLTHIQLLGTSNAALASSQRLGQPVLPATAVNGASNMEVDRPAPPGWRLLGSEWKPCPIGVLRV